MKAQQIPQMITDLFNSNHQVVVLEGDEYHRYLEGIQKAADAMQVKVVCHDKIGGLYTGKPPAISPQDRSNLTLVAWPLMVMSHAKEYRLAHTVDPKEDIIFVLKDWDTEWFQNPDGPKIVQQIRNLIHSNLGAPQITKGQEGEEDEVARGQRMFVFITTSGKVPVSLPELKPITVPLPDYDAMREMIDVQVFDPIEERCNDTAGVKGYLIPDETRTIIAKSLAGLTLQGAEDAVSLALVKHGGVTDVDAILEVIEDAKSRAAEAIPGLSYVGKNLQMRGSMPGFELAESFLHERSAIDSAVLAKHNLRRDIRAMTLVGAPGVGKTQFAYMVGALLKKPLYLWNLGESKGGVVGVSEANLRRTIQLLQAQEAVCMIDDFDKGVGGGGSGSSYNGDGGVSEGILQGLLTQMSDPANKIVFVITLNRINNIKTPELLRRGRMDRVFMVARPNATTRKAILRTHVLKRNFEWLGGNDSVIDKLCQHTMSDWVGAEIEALVEDVAYRSLAAGKTELDWVLMGELANKTVPLAKQAAFKGDVEVMEKAAEGFDIIGNVDEDELPVVAAPSTRSRQVRSLVVR